MKKIDEKTMEKVSKVAGITSKIAGVSLVIAGMATKNAKLGTAGFSWLLVDSVVDIGLDTKDMVVEAMEAKATAVEA